MSPLFSRLLLLFVGGKSGNLAYLIVDDCVSLSNGGFEVGSADMFPPKRVSCAWSTSLFPLATLSTVTMQGCRCGVGWGWGWGWG